MIQRRRFLKLSIAGTGSAMLPYRGLPSFTEDGPMSAVGSGAIVLSTWKHGMPANAKAWEVMRSGGSVLDAVEQGVAVVESDFTNRSVGLGGMPDRDGKVTLDACIQDHDGRSGAVAFVQEFEHPVSIARAVMERTPHAMLVGNGAEQWASANGFRRRKVHVPEVRQAWKEWLRTSEYKPGVNVENRKDVPERAAPKGSSDQHDTIGLIAMDATGRLAGSCTTSGMAWKVHGRVGDSPIIGAGLFVDGDVGAACATGVGELVIRTAGSHAIVELMRQGRSPSEACREVVLRILRKTPGLDGMQVGFLAIRGDGAFGGWSVYEGFDFALRTEDRDVLLNAGHERIWR